MPSVHAVPYVHDASIFSSVYFSMKRRQKLSALKFGYVCIRQKKESCSKIRIYLVTLLLSNFALIWKQTFEFQKKPKEERKFEKFSSEFGL